MKLNFFSSIILLLIFTLSTKVHAQPSIPAYEALVKDFVTGALEDIGTVPGVSMVVVKGDQTIFVDGMGYADIEKKVPMEGNTNFYIASCTKSFTALLATILDSEGILDLDMTLAEALPKIKFGPEIKADQIRMRDFFNHTSGIDHPSIGTRLAYTGEHDHKTLMSLLPYVEPNEAGYGIHEYTNTGYNIYTIILEERTGKPWQQWMEEKIFNPLGMDRTTAYMSRAKNKNWPMAKPYFGLSPDQMELVYLEKKDNTMQSAGGLTTTATDVAKWLKMQISQGRLNGKQVFPKSSLEESLQDPAEITRSMGRFEMTGYSLGWAQGTFGGEKVVLHSGGFPGLLSIISFMPEEEIGVAVFVNDGLAGFPLSLLIANYAYDAYFQPEGWNNSYDKELKQLTKKSKALKQRVISGRAKRAKRTWALQEPFENYTGTFVNDMMGAVKIELVNPEELEFTLGNLHCIATPFTEDNTMRVEAIPGSGSVVRFNMEGSKATSFTLDGMEFKKQ